MSNGGNGRANGILNRYVLVLNQSYEPVMVTNAKRAVILLILDKAEEVVNYPEIIHSASLQMPLPSVVRLSRYVPIRFGGVSGSPTFCLSVSS